jgi:hypothetical protein
LQLQVAQVAWESAALFLANADIWPASNERVEERAGEHHPTRLSAMRKLVQGPSLVIMGRAVIHDSEVIPVGAGRHAHSGVDLAYHGSGLSARKPPCE